VQCLLCEAGTFADARGMEECVPCAAGSFAPDDGMAECEVCPEGDYTKDEGQAACQKCSQAPFGEGYFSLADSSTCYACTEHGDCEGGIFNGAKPGYWAPFPLYKTLEDGMNASIFPCPKGDKSCLGGLNSSCAANFTDRCCNFCIDGLYYNLVKQRCVSCNGGEPSESIFFGVLVALAAAVVFTIMAVLFCVTYKLNAREAKKRAGMEGMLMGQLMEMEVVGSFGTTAPSPGGGGGGMFEPLKRVFENAANDLQGVQEKGKIMISNFQIMGSFPSMFGNIAWPSAALSVAGFSGFLNVDVTKELQLDCFARYDYTLVLYTTLAIALVVVVGIPSLYWFFCSFALHVFPDHFSAGGDGSWNIKFRAWTCKLWFLFSFLLYPQISNKVLNLFYCADYGEPSTYLYADLRFECWTDTHYEHVIIAAVAAALFVVGLPATFLALLWAHRDSLDTPKTRLWLGFLYNKYRVDKWYWEEVELFRKLLLMTAVTFVTPGEDTQMLAAMAICFMFLVLIAYNEPYRNATDTIVALGAYISQFIALWGALLVRLKFNSDQIAIDTIIAVSMFAPLGIIGAILILAVGARLNDKRLERKEAKRAAAEAKAKADTAEAEGGEVPEASSADDGAAEATNERVAARVERRTEASTRLLVEASETKRLRQSTTTRV